MTGISKASQPVVAARSTTRSPPSSIGRWRATGLSLADATYVKVRASGRIVSVAASSLSPSTATAGARCWASRSALRGRDLLDRVLRSLAGVACVASSCDLGCHEGSSGGCQSSARLLAALPGTLHAQCLGPCWQHGGVSSLPHRHPFAQEDAEMPAPNGSSGRSAQTQGSKLAIVMDEAEADVLAFMSFPKDHPPKITAPTTGRLNAKSSVAPTSSASSPTRTPSRLVALSSSSRTINGPCSAPLHDPGNHGSVERGSNLQAARRGGLMKPAKPPESAKTPPLYTSLGTRSCNKSTSAIRNRICNPHG